jgi:hypothetical protein
MSVDFSEGPVTLGMRLSVSSLGDPLLVRAREGTDERALARAQALALLAFADLVNDHENSSGVIT